MIRSLKTPQGPAPGGTLAGNIETRNRGPGRPRRRRRTPSSRREGDVVGECTGGEDHAGDGEHGARQHRPRGRGGGERRATAVTTEASAAQGDDVDDEAPTDHGERDTGDEELLLPHGHKEQHADARLHDGQARRVAHRPLAAARADEREGAVGGDRVGQVTKAHEVGHRSRRQHTEGDRRQHDLVHAAVRSRSRPQSTCSSSASRRVS